MMPHEKNLNLYDEVMEEINERGIAGMGQVVSLLMNEAMRIERSKVIAAGPWERTEGRCGYANGYKPRSIDTRLGCLKLNVPQVRDGVEFYPSALERGVRSERALKVAIAEMYVQGVSTRKVTAVLEQLCGLEVTAMQVSRAAKMLDDELEKWRNRPLGEMLFVQLDARYEKVRRDNAVSGAAVLVATGVGPDGKRSILGVSVSISEAEVHWRNFLSGLKARGLCGVKMFTSDNHEGLKAGLKAVFGGVPWTRCHVHIQRNAAAYVPATNMKAAVAEDIRRILGASGRTEAEALLEKTVEKYRPKARKLADWMDANLPDGFNVLSLPPWQCKRLRSTNMVERLNREIKRRTRVASIFPNEESLLRLVSAILVETNDEWETGGCYLNVKDREDGT
jgi:transposase-like protein